jgi:hypothetical protein
MCLVLLEHLTKPLEGKVDTEHTSVKQLLSRVARLESRNTLAGYVRDTVLADTAFRQHSNSHTLK